MTDKIDETTGRNLFEQMVDGENFENLADDFFNFESDALNNPFILKFATQEEMALYKMMDEIPDEDVKQALKNMAEILESDEEEREIIMSMNRYFLKLLLIERWTERAVEHLAS